METEPDRFLRYVYGSKNMSDVALRCLRKPSTCKATLGCDTMDEEPKISTADGRMGTSYGPILWPGKFPEVGSESNDKPWVMSHPLVWEEDEVVGAEEVAKAVLAVTLDTGEYDATEMVKVRKTFLSISGKEYVVALALWITPGCETLSD